MGKRQAYQMIETEDKYSLGKEHSYNACIQQLGKPSLKRKKKFTKQQQEKHKAKQEEKPARTFYKPVDPQELASLPSEYQAEHEELCSVLEYDLGIEREQVDRLALMMVKMNIKYDKSAIADDK